MNRLNFYVIAISFISVATVSSATADEDVGHVSPSPPISSLATISVPKPFPITTAKPIVQVEGEPIRAGNVVVGGEYIERPYRVSLSGRNVYINEKRVTSLPKLHTSLAKSDGEFIAKLERTLFWGSTVIVFDEKTRLVVDSTEADTFWAAMLDAATIEEKVRIVFEQADYDEFSKNHISTAQWRSALTDFTPTKSLVESVTSDCFEYYVEDGESHPAEQTSKIASPFGSGWVMYLLNSSGMLLAAISFGVLITNPPKANATWIDRFHSPSAIQLVRKCLILTVVLSVFDLVSTVTAESTGGFTEANPLAAFFIHDLSLLTFAKLFGTFLTTGLLWSQREYVGVQLASWWICFVLTLVTIRWVVVDSLFYV